MFGESRCKPLARVTCAAPLILLGSALLCLVGCVGPSWEPPAPQGQTYEYDFQGYQQASTTVVAGSRPGVGYGAAFHFRGRKGVRDFDPGKDPFAQSARIDGVHFNEHLQGQGTRLEPGGTATLSPTAAPATAAAATAAAAAAAAANAAANANANASRASAAASSAAPTPPKAMKGGSR